MKSRPYLAFLFATLAVAFGAAQVPSQQTGSPSSGKQENLSATLPLDTTVIKGHLPNGITYYVRANHKPEKRAELRLVVNAGSILEDDDQQ